MNNSKHIEILEQFLELTKDAREWKRGQVVKLRLLGVSYQIIRQTLGVSNRFIAYCQQKYRQNGIQGLKLAYKGSTPFLTRKEKEEIQEWLKPLERRNISELERHLMEKYNVCFKSRQSYYKILAESELTWQKGNKENRRKDQEKSKKK